MPTNEEHMEKLKQLLCEASRCEARHATDFIIMSVYIRQRTHETVGVNTLKRFYNYGCQSAIPRMQTLNVLARSLGYRNYDDFCNHYADTSDSASDIVMGQHISSSLLVVGERILLRWNPGRECLAEYLGNDTYRVVTSQQTKLAVGDTFQAPFFALGHTAMLANLIHGDTSFPLYEIGKQGGLTLAEIVRNDE
ncbi:MAG: hypothetical protein II793_01960 [Bacteroidales bacterium]|nr:hypothetical protein [Bacteroidales bacterium]